MGVASPLSRLLTGVPQNLARIALENRKTARFGLSRRRGKTHIRKGGKARNGVWWHTDTADVKNGRKATPVMTQEESEPDYINLKEPEYVPDPIDNQQPTIPYDGEM